MLRKDFEAAVTDKTPDEVIAAVDDLMIRRSPRARTGGITVVGPRIQ